MIQPIIGREFFKKVLPAIQQAKKEILIIVYDWRWYPDQIGASIQKFNQEIVRKAKTGVSIKAILNTKETAKILEEQGIKTNVRDFGGLLHTKLMIIDEKIVIIGSHNYTYNAFETNFEASVMIENEEIAKIFKNYFQNLWR
jgi:phosphatidylserine/phosphatidylglycerophosphate/cardiolipin synthase-like enzyme